MQRLNLGGCLAGGGNVCAITGKKLLQAGRALEPAYPGAPGTVENTVSVRVVVAPLALL